MSLFKVAEVPEPVLPKSKEADGVSVEEGKNRLLIGKGLVQLERVVGCLTKGAVLQYVTHGKWSMHELVTYLLMQTGAANVYLSTWTVTEEPVRALVNLKNTGLIQDLYCLFDYRIKDRKAEAFQLLQSICTEHKLVKCHAKTVVIYNEDWQVTILSSANFSKNPRIEVGAIFVDEKSANFHRAWILGEIHDQNLLKNDAMD